MSRCSWLQTQVGSGFFAELDEKMSSPINKAAPGCRGREPYDVLNSTQTLSPINHWLYGSQQGHSRGVRAAASSSGRQQPVTPLRETHFRQQFLHMFPSSGRHWSDLFGKLRAPSPAAGDATALHAQDPCATQHRSNGSIQTKPTALQSVRRQHLNKILNIRLTSFILYWRGRERNRRKISCLCLPMDTAKQTRRKTSATRLTNKLQLLLTDTSMHLAWETGTEHKFHKYSLFDFLLRHSQHASTICHDCSYRSVTPFLK